MSAQATGNSHLLAAAGQASDLLEMQINVCGNLQTLRLRGELDIASAPLLEAALELVCGGSCATILALDLGDVTFVDSTGLRAILLAKDLCAKAGRRFRVIRACAQVERLFEITGVHGELLFGTRAASGS